MRTRQFALLLRLQGFSNKTHELPEFLLRALEESEVHDAVLVKERHSSKQIDRLPILVDVGCAKVNTDTTGEFPRRIERDPKGLFPPAYRHVIGMFDGTRIRFCQGPHRSVSFRADASRAWNLSQIGPRQYAGKRISASPGEAFAGQRSNTVNPSVSYSRSSRARRCSTRGS